MMVYYLQLGCTKVSINNKEENTMKKILAIALALVMVLGMVACGGNGGNGGEAAATKVSVCW